MKDKSKNLIEAMKKSRLTAVEKARLKLSVMAAIEKSITKKDVPSLSPYAPKRSPYTFRFSYVLVGRIASVSIFILMVAAGGLSYASADALPGDMLYSVKINFKEKIEEGFVFTPEKKIALRQKRIEDRFVEVEKLIEEKRITPETRSIAEVEIEIEKQKIAENIEEINKENPVAAEEAKTTLESSINERREQIDDQIEGIEENKEIEALEKELADFEATLDAETDIELFSETPASEEETAPTEPEAEAEINTPQ